MKLELVPVPVSDVDRAKTFYVDKVGFNVDHDVRPNDTVRVVQLTLPGSACSIVLATGLPGIEIATWLAQRPASRRSGYSPGPPRAGRGVAVSEIDEHPRGIKYAYFSDPDGNTWTLQEIPPGI